MLKAIIEHFAKDGNEPGSDWAHAEDMSSFGLDCRTKDGAKFWLDLNGDETISVRWKAPGGSSVTQVFVLR